jgi:hypothetical protein
VKVAPSGSPLAGCRRFSPENTLKGVAHCVRILNIPPIFPVRPRLRGTSRRPPIGSCAYQKVDPLANWKVRTGNIRLGVSQTLMAWRTLLLVLKGGGEVKAVRGSRPPLGVRRRGALSAQRSTAELSARRLCTFLREFSSLRRQKRLRESDADPRFCVSTRATCGFRFSRHRLQKRGPWSPWSDGRSALVRHAAASTDGHVSQAADRLVETAAALRHRCSSGSGRCPCRPVDRRWPQETAWGEERAQHGRCVREVWASACSSVGIRVAVAGVMTCDRGDMNFRSGEVKKRVGCR